MDWSPSPSSGKINFSLRMSARLLEELWDTMEPHSSESFLESRSLISCSLFSFSSFCVKTAANSAGGSWLAASVGTLKHRKDFTTEQFNLVIGWVRAKKIKFLKTRKQKINFTWQFLGWKQCFQGGGLTRVHQHQRIPYYVESALAFALPVAACTSCLLCSWIKWMT